MLRPENNFIFRTIRRHQCVPKRLQILVFVGIAVGQTLMMFSTSMEDRGIVVTPYDPMTSGLRFEVPINSVPEKRRSVSAGPSFDLISIGSKTRLDYQDAQQRTFGSHVSVRNFFRITEDHDDEPTCDQNLTAGDLNRISVFCRNQKWPNSFLMRYKTKAFAPPKWLQKKANPVGWMCAQKRPIYGLALVVQRYRENNEPLPDYIVIMDDDTYYNMELVSRFLGQSNNNTFVAIAGCLLRYRVHEINFTFPFGGFGMIYGKGALENLMRPIRCAGNTQADDFLETSCKRMKENLIGELAVFREGMSLLDLIQTYSSSQRYSSYRNWSYGFCLHSDWMWGYVTNFYPISVHDPDPFYELVPHARLLAYGSEMYPGQLAPEVRDKLTQCDHGRNKCHQAAHICHYQDPATMKMLANGSHFAR